MMRDGYGTMERVNIAVIDIVNRDLYFFLS